MLLVRLFRVILDLIGFCMQFSSNRYGFVLETLG